MNAYFFLGGVASGSDPSDAKSERFFCTGSQLNKHGQVKLKDCTIIEQDLRFGRGDSKALHTPHFSRKNCINSDKEIAVME